MRTAAEIKRTARLAGVLYLLMSLEAIFAYFYLGRLFFVAGDPAATAQAIVTRLPLYRLSILLGLAGGVLFTLVVLALYRLFRDVDRGQASAMVALVGTGIVAQFAGFVLKTAPLVLLGDAPWLSVFGREQLEAFSYLALSLSNKQGALLMWLWGLWLFPFAVLTWKSGFLPRFLAVLLVLSGAAYVVACIASIGFPAQAPMLSRFLMPLYFGEFVVVLWLALVGARPRAAEA